MIRKKLEGVANVQDINYEFLYSNLENQEIIAKPYTLIMKARNDILNLSSSEEPEHGMDDDVSDATKDNDL